MRLVCPNCEAKYEVPDDAIPDTGRDVQCANCGHAWFQMRARAAAVAPPIAVTVAAPAVPKVAEASVPSAPAVELQGGDDVADDGDALADGAVPVQDEKVLTILREEAEREAKARREKTRLLDAPRDPEGEAEPRKKVVAKKKDPEPVPVAEPQPAPIPEPAPAPRPAPPPMPEIEPEIELKVAARRDLLPDVEEIKSTLQPSDTEEPEFASGLHGDGDGRERSGAFRSGFLTVITIAILGASVYSSSHWLSAKVPALSGPLSSYVAAVDDLRLQLDGLMRAATLQIAGQKG